MNNTPERIQKVLARAGLGSRREVEAWIDAGRLRVNGSPARPGQKIIMQDKVSLDGKPLQLDSGGETDNTRILMYHKPVGEICSRRDEKGRPEVFAALPAIRHGRWINIGRLDINTSGLLLFTNNGELANRLMHPSSEIEREYAVRVAGKVDREMLDRLQDGVELEDGPARFESIRDAGGQGVNHWYHVVIREGRNREIRRLWESQDVTVSRLIRVRYGPCSLPRNLRSGKYRELDDSAVQELLRSVNMEYSPRPEARKSRRKPRATRPANN